LPEDMDSLRYSMRTDGKSGFVFVNHYQRLAKLHDVNNVVIDTGVVKFPAFDVKGEIAFVLPFGLRLDEETLEYATAQPICREGDTYFFTEIPGITAEYKFADRDALQVKAGMGHWLKVGDIKIVTLTWDQARFLRKLEGEVYVGEECDLIWQDKRVKAAAPGVHHYYSWEGEDGFERLTTGKVFTQAEIAIEPLESIPFTPKYMEELALGSERALSYAKVSVTTAEGFVEIPNVGDVLQLYTAENEMIADNFYYGKPWRLPAKLLFGKELYLVVSEFKDDFYKEY